MNSISIDNEKYVKATDIARELGYTADYVGQLCRANKVVAQLVGRSWYVSEDSIRAHKKNRYRSIKSASKKSIVTTLETKDLDEKDSFVVSVNTQDTPVTIGYAKKSFYSRTQSPSSPEYSDDESDLIPACAKAKTGRLSVSLGDAQSVRIKSHATEFDFNPTPLPEIKFKGSLSVSAVYDSSDEENPEKDSSADDLIEAISKINNVEKPEKIEHVKTNDNERAIIQTVDSGHKVKVRHLRKNTKKKSKNLKMEYQPLGVLGMQRERVIGRNPVGGTLKINVPAKSTFSTTKSVYIVVTSAMTATVLSLLIMGIQSDVQVVGSELLVSYAFTFDTLVAAVSNAW